MTHQQAIDAAQARLVELAVEHQKQLNALALRKAILEVEKAEWETHTARICCAHVCGIAGRKMPEVRRGMLPDELRTLLNKGKSE